MNKSSKSFKIDVVTWDKGEDPTEAIKAALKGFGLYVYDAPDFDGSGDTCLMISNKKRTPEQLEKDQSMFWPTDEEA